MQTLVAKLNVQVRLRLSRLEAQLGQALACWVAVFPSLHEHAPLSGVLRVCRQRVSATSRWRDVRTPGGGGDGGVLTLRSAGLPGMPLALWSGLSQQWTMVAMCGMRLPLQSANSPPKWLRGKSALASPALRCRWCGLEVNSELRCLLQFYVCRSASRPNWVPQSPRNTSDHIHGLAMYARRLCLPVLSSVACADWPGIVSASRWLPRSCSTCWVRPLERAALCHMGLQLRSGLLWSAVAPLRLNCNSLYRSSQPPHSAVGVAVCWKQRHLNPRGGRRRVNNETLGFEGWGCSAVHACSDAELERESCDNIKRRRQSRELRNA